MSKHMEIIKKEFITSEEMEYLQECISIKSIECNGLSGNNNGYYWYTVKTNNNRQYSIYLQ